MNEISEKTLSLLDCLLNNREAITELRADAHAESVYDYLLRDRERLIDALLEEYSDFT